MDKIKMYRDFLKDSIRKTIDFCATDQHQGVPAPPLEEKVDQNSPRISSPDKETWSSLIEGTDLVHTFGNRQSRRNFND